MYAGDVYEITWDYDATSGDYVNLYYNTNHGTGAWTTITSNTPNDGVYDWVIPSGIDSDACRIITYLHDSSKALAGADGSYGDFEIQSGGSIQILGSDAKVNTATDPDYYQFYHSYSTWCAVGVRNNTAGENWSMRMFDDNTFSNELVTSTYTYPVDYVIMDGNHTPSVYRGIKVYQVSGSNNASVEFEGFTETITPGSTYNDSWPAGDVVEMYDVHLTPGTYSFDLTFNSGSTDLDIALFGSSGSAYYGNRQDYLARSINAGNGVNESFTFTIATEDDYGFCVWANNANNANFDILIDPMIAGLWTGNTNYNWNLASNWDDGNVPDASIDVLIPSSYTYRPIISYADANCNNVTVESGAVLEIQDYDMNVSGSMTIYGELKMSDNLGNLYVDNDIIWESGSTADITAPSPEMYISGNWNFEDGANVQLDNGYVEFEGSTNKYIRSYESNCYFNNVRSDKNNAFIGVSNWSSDTLRINGNLYQYSKSSFHGYSNYPIILNGFFNNMGGHFLFDYGEFVYNGAAAGTPLKPNSGDYFNHLRINSGTQALSLSADYSDTLRIKGNFIMDSGYFNPGAFIIEVGADWRNNAGIGYFYESSSRVVFNGSGHHYVYPSETFDTLEVNCVAALRVNNVNHTVTCSTYDWTSGGIDVINGTFTALDLADDGLYGGFWLNPGGTINLTQGTTAGEYIDLNCYLWISGGTMNVYGGSFTSYWPFSDNAEIDMNGGVLDFHDNGIKIYDSPTYSFTENITGGVIRTPLSFTGDRSDFNPDGGTIELYGSINANLSMGSGSSLYNVKVNKTAKENITKNTKKPEYEIVRNRDGTTRRYSRANTVLLTTDCVVDNELTITDGALTLNGHELTVNENLDVYGTLNMTNAADILYLGSNYYDLLTFKSGSVSELTKGVVNIKGWFHTAAGCSVTTSTDNTVLCTGIDGGGLYNDEPTFSYGNIEIDKNAGSRTYVHFETTQPIIVDGDFTIHPDNDFETQSHSVIVHGSFSDENTSEIYVYETNPKHNQADGSTLEKSSAYKETKTKGGSLEIDTDYTQNGLLDVGDGDVLIHGEYELVSTGTLNIDGGSFICDAAYSKGDKGYQNIFGEFNMSGGLFEITNNSLQFVSGVHNISGGTIRIGNIFYANNADVFQPTGGVVEMSSAYVGGSLLCSNANNNYFHDLVIDDNTPLSTDITINNNLEIHSGSLNTSGHDIDIGGDWTNNVGDSGFEEASSRVVFNGLESQYINSNEIFNVLEIDCADTVKIDNPDYTVTCETYDWTSGGIEVTGTFTALDLEDNGIYGSYWINAEGTINLNQGIITGDYVDLNGDLHISGGTMNVYGGSTQSIWPMYDNAEINMSGGVIDFHDVGILIYNNPSFSLVENITNGTIRTAHSFDCDRSDFTPVGGFIELYGSTEADLSMGYGSNYYLVNINKSSVKSRKNNKYDDSQFTTLKNRAGNIIRRPKSNTVNVTSDLLINASLIVNNGTFNLNGNKVETVNDVYIHDNIEM